MKYWNPSNKEMEDWAPHAGWSAVFSEADKIHYVNLFFFFKNKKGFNDMVSEIMAEMILFKQKYKGLEYSEEQEAKLAKSLFTR